MTVTKRALALFAGFCALSFGAVSVRADSGGMRFTKSLIDTEYTCSVTIHDYVSNNGETTIVIDGNAIDAAGILPDGARPVCDAGFAFLKIADLKMTWASGSAGVVCTNVSVPFLALAREILPGTFSQRTTYTPEELLTCVGQVCNISESGVRSLIRRRGVQLPDTDEDGETSASGLETGLYLFAETDSPEGVIPGPPVCLMLPQTNITEITVGTEAYEPGEIWLYDIDIYPKSRSVSIDKVIVTDNDSASEPQMSNTATAHIGEQVTFLVTSDVPKVSSDVRNRLYKIEDRMQKGLIYDGNLGVALGQTEETAEILTEKSDYKISLSRTESGGESLSVTFTKKGLARLDLVPASSRIYMRYRAHLSPDAEIAGEGNRNEAYLSYGTDHSDDYSVASPPVTVYTYRLSLKKSFTPAQDHFGKVKFSVASGGEIIYFVKETDGVYRTAGPGEENNETELVSPNDMSGLLTLKGLANGSYIITEEETLADYSLLSTQIEVTIKNRNMQLDVENKKSIDLVHTGGAGLFETFAIASFLSTAGILILYHAKKKD